MVKLFLSGLLVLFGSLCQLKAQERSVYGNVSDPIRSKGIDNITLLNTRSGQVVITNPAGDFYLRALVGDSILITSFGYNRLGIKWDGKSKNVNILAKLQPFTLPELVVFEKSIKELNEEIAYFLAHPNDGNALRDRIKSKIVNTNTTQPGIGFSIDDIYDLFSKKGKEKFKLADMQSSEIKKFYTELKYNKSMVSSITKLGGEDLGLFMQYCSPSQYFILTATDYDLTKKILDCLKGFRIRQINGSALDLHSKD